IIPSPARPAKTRGLPMPARHPSTILATCVIPWDEQENLLEEVFRQEIRYLHALGIDHLYIFGTAGEGYAVDTARFREIVTVLREETRHTPVQAQVGIIGMSVAQVVERLRIAYDAGFRAFQISLPAWRGLNDVELLRYFQDICGTFSDCTFLHYNLSLSYDPRAADDHHRPAAQVPNLVATKNSCVDGIPQVDPLQKVPELQHYL